LLRGEEVATVDRHHRRTWNETKDRVSRLASGLTSLGVSRGDRVAILALNSHRYMEAIFAIASCGAVVVPLNTRLAPPEIRFMLEDGGASVVFADEGFIALAQATEQDLESLEHAIFMADSPERPDTLTYESLIRKSGPMPAVAVEGHEMLGLFYTGGTTGRSKGVMLSNDNFMINTLQTVAASNMDDDTTYLHAAPMFHIADFIGMLMHLVRGGPHVFVPGFEPLAVMKMIEAESIVWSLLIPAMIGMLVNHPDIDDYDLSSLKFITYGGSPISEGVLAQTMKVLPDISLMQAYGQTETSPILTTLGPEWHYKREGHSSKIRSAGRPVAGVDICIMDEDGKPMELGETGEICVRGPNIMLGYWQLPELSAQTLRGGWLHTGDGGYLDEDGFLFVVDRVKDMIVSGGENVYSSEVESAISKFDGVVACAVIGIPHEQWGEQVHAEICMREGAQASVEDIMDHCRLLIAGFKCPKSINFRSQPLPLSGAGKVLKKDLRAPFWQGKQRSVS
jgi:acyl-CoA synthetase (AMP-forming)/AMP-acid ligase II